MVDTAAEEECKNISLSVTDTIIASYEFRIRTTIDNAIPRTDASGSFGRIEEASATVLTATAVQLSVLCRAESLALIPSIT